MTSKSAVMTSTSAVMAVLKNVAALAVATMEGVFT